MLAPHDREQGEFEVVGVASEDADNFVALTVRQPEGAVQRLSSLRHQVGQLVSARVHAPKRTRLPMAL